MSRTGEHGGSKVSARVKYAVSETGSVWIASDEEAREYEPECCDAGDGLLLRTSDEYDEPAFDGFDWIIVEWDAVPGGALDEESAWYRWAFRRGDSDSERGWTWDVVARNVREIIEFWRERTDVVQLPHIDPELLLGLKRLAKSPIMDIFAKTPRYWEHLRWWLDTYDEACAFDAAEQEMCTCERLVSGSGAA